MKQILAASLLLLGPPATAQTIETAGGDWRNTPEMRRQGDAAVDPNAVAAIAEMVDRGECTIPGQRRSHLEMSVPFLVLFRADGSIERLIVHPLGCARGDGVLGGAILRLVEQRQFVPAGGRRAGWFRGEVSLTYSEQ
jgi:hypothetical protein